MATIIPTKYSKPSHFITTADYSAEQLFNLVESTIKFKLESKYNYPKARTERPLTGKTVALFFSKRSTRTRIAAETSTNYLGGKVMFLGSHDSQYMLNETLVDSCRITSSMVCGIVARVSSHKEVETLAKESSVPVINALSDKHHPTEIVADLVTLHEYFHNKKKSKNTTDSYTAHTQHPRETLKGLKVAWIGDVNNILREILVGFPKCGISVSAACPPGYVCDEDIVNIAKNDAQKSGASVFFTTKPEEAVKDCDAIITDTWISMGNEEEKNQRLLDFAGYQITNDLAIRGGAKPDWIFMHCLPRKQEEVDDDVFYSERSIVYHGAENRKWTFHAVLNSLLVKGSI